MAIKGSKNTKAELLNQIRILEKKLEMLETLASNVHAGVELHDCGGGFLIRYINEGFTLLTGYTPDDLRPGAQDGVSLTHAHLVHKDDLPVFERELAKQLKNGDAFSLEYRMIRKDGKIIRVIDQGQVMNLPDGTACLQCTLMDITARKKQEEDLVFSEKRYQIALEISGITMFEYDIVTRELILYENTAQMYRLSGPIPEGPETLIKRGIIEPESVSVYLDMYAKIHSGEPSARCYVKTRDAEGVVHDFQLILTSIFDSDGNPVKAIGVRKNVYEILSLQKENDFVKNLMRDKNLIFEADVSNDKITYFHEIWREKMNFSGKVSLAALVLKLSDMTAPEYKQIVLEKLFPEQLKNLFKQGRSFVVFDYKFLEQDGGYSWYEAFVSIIRDRASGNIKARFYHTDVSERKIKNQRMLEEKQMYESMISQAKLAYEVNVTRNAIVRGHEKLCEAYGFLTVDVYDKLIRAFAEKKVHPEDQQSFKCIFCRKNLLAMFKKDETRAYGQYRRLEDSGGYRWTACTLHLYEELETGDIKGFAYITDIDEEKRAELALKYNAEHDGMTGVYNKSTTEKIIDQYLKTSDGCSSSHALLIVDIDYFKNVNDTFGHQFGDTVITEISVKIKSLFRKQDIIGRVGGDEFCVFIQRIESVRVVREKAAEICKRILCTYTQDGKSCTVSASVGISLYSEHGSTYEDLFLRADKALYLAKKNGRNRHEFFRAE